MSRSSSFFSLLSIMVPLSLSLCCHNLLTGTHWWHAHSGVQRADGVYGSFIVRQNSEAERHRTLYDVDDPRHVLLLQEWSKQTAIAISTGHMHGVPGIVASDGILVNGRGKLTAITIIHTRGAIRLASLCHVLWLHRSQVFRILTLQRSKKYCLFGLLILRQRSNFPPR